MSGQPERVLEPEAGDAERRDQILEAARHCFAQVGIQRTSVSDVAKMADVSRATVYRYFADRTELVDAAIDFGARKFYRDMAEAMAKKSTLAEQMGAMAEVHASILLNQRTHPRLMANDTELVHHIIADGDSAVARTAEFLTPYVRAAKKRGEIGSAFTVSAASEWLARIIFSFAILDGGRNFDLAKPASVRRFVQTFAINGLR